MKGKKTGGRQKGSQNKSRDEVKDLLDSEVDFKIVVGKLYELVKGVEVEQSIGDQSIVYSKPPDSSAAKILMEYRFGKPAQSVDLTTQGDSLNPPKQNVIRLANGTEITI